MLEKCSARASIDDQAEGDNVVVRWVVLIDLYMTECANQIFLVRQVKWQHSNIVSILVLTTFRKLLKIVPFAEPALLTTRKVEVDGSKPLAI